MKYNVDISPDAKNEDEHCVKIDYVIDDRQNYGRFVH